MIACHYWHLRGFLAKKGATEKDYLKWQLHQYFLETGDKTEFAPTFEERAYKLFRYGAAYCDTRLAGRWLATL